MYQCSTHWHAQHAARRDAIAVALKVCRCLVCGNAAFGQPTNGWSRTKVQTTGGSSTVTYCRHRLCFCRRPSPSSPWTALRPRLTVRDTASRGYLLRLSGREHMSGYNVFYKQPLAFMPMLCGRPLPTPSREAAVRRPPLYPTQTFLPPSGAPKILPSCLRPRHTRPLPENMPTAWWTHPLPAGWQSTLLPKYVCWSRCGAPPPHLPVTSAAADATATAAVAVITAKAMPAVAVRVVSGAPPSATQLAAVTQPKSASARARRRGGAGAVEVLPPTAMRRRWRGRHLRRRRPGETSHAQRSAAHRHVQCRRHHQRHRCSPQQHRLRRCLRRDGLDAAPFAPPVLSRGAPPCAGSGFHARTATTAGGGPHNRRRSCPT